MKSRVMEPLVTVDCKKSLNDGAFGSYLFKRISILTEMLLNRVICITYQKMFQFY